MCIVKLIAVDKRIIVLTVLGALQHAFVGHVTQLMLG